MMNRTIKEGYNVNARMYWIEDPLSKEQYAEARANGVGYSTAYSRRHLCGWSKHDVINVPVKSKDSKFRVRDKYRKQRIALGISEWMFDQRVFTEGIDPEVFLASPELHKRKKAPTRKYHITDEQFKIAEANGIPRRTVQNRMSRKSKNFSIERAITEPVGSHGCAKRFAK